jgi:hypothetical protein
MFPQRKGSCHHIPECGHVHQTTRHHILERGTSLPAYITSFPRIVTMASYPRIGTYHNTWCHITGGVYIYIYLQTHTHKYCTISDSLQISKLDGVTYHNTIIIKFTAMRISKCQAETSVYVLLV